MQPLSAICARWISSITALGSNGANHHEAPTPFRCDFGKLGLAARFHFYLLLRLEEVLLRRFDQRYNLKALAEKLTKQRVAKRANDSLSLLTGANVGANPIPYPQTPSSVTSTLITVPTISADFAAIDFWYIVLNTRTEDT